MVCYERYINLESLLELQIPVTASISSETIFIVVHQSHELYFKVIIGDVGDLIVYLGAGEICKAIDVVNRIENIALNLAHQVFLLNSIPFDEFESIRAILSGASGAESQQYHHIVALMADIGSHTSFGATQNVWLAVHELIMQGVAPHETDPNASLSSPDMLENVLRRIMRQESFEIPREPDLFALLCSLMRLDLAFARWRDQHYRIALRLLGDRPGTGGSSGAEFLKARAKRYMFPQLWMASGQTPLLADIEMNGSKMSLFKSGRSTIEMEGT